MSPRLEEDPLKTIIIPAASGNRIMENDSGLISY
jgi:hypothetical protein